jgi:hypothetical protein
LDNPRENSTVAELPPFSVVVGAFTYAVGAGVGVFVGTGVGVFVGTGVAVVTGGGVTVGAAVGVLLGAGVTDGVTDGVVGTVVTGVGVTDGLGAGVALHKACAAFTVFAAFAIEPVKTSPLNAAEGVPFSRINFLIATASALVQADFVRTVSPVM